jgi:hypothetical protein
MRIEGFIGYPDWFFNYINEITTYSRLILTSPMPTRIRVPHRIPPHIEVPIPIHRIARLRHDTIRAEEVGGQGVVKSGPVIIQADVLKALAGKEPVGRQRLRAGGLDERAVGQVVDAAHFVAALIRDEAGRAEVVGVDIVYLVVDAGGNSLAVNIVVFGHLRFVDGDVEPVGVIFNRLGLPDGGQLIPFTQDKSKEYR